MIYATTQPTLLEPRRIHKVDMKMFRISIYFAFTKKARKLGGSDGKASPYNAGDPGWEDSLEKEMATHSSTLAWKIPCTEETGRLQFMGSQRVGHN